MLHGQCSQFDILTLCQNILYAAHTAQETAQKFGKRNDAEVEMQLAQCLRKLKEYRDKNRPRPHLDDKILTSCNGLMVRLYWTFDPMTPILIPEIDIWLVQGCRSIPAYEQQPATGRGRRGVHQGEAV